MTKRGNPNQARLVKELRDLGFKVWVKHNQIHIEGVRTSVFYPDYVAPEGETYGMTIAEARQFKLEVETCGEGPKTKDYRGVYRGVII